MDINGIFETIKENWMLIAAFSFFLGISFSARNLLFRYASSYEAADILYNIQIGVVGLLGFLLGAIPGMPDVFETAGWGHRVWFYGGAASAAAISMKVLKRKGLDMAGDTDPPPPPTSAQIMEAAKVLQSIPPVARTGKLTKELKEEMMANPPEGFSVGVPGKVIAPDGSTGVKQKG